MRTLRSCQDGREATQAEKQRARSWPLMEALAAPGLMSFSPRSGPSAAPALLSTAHCDGGVSGGCGGNGGTRPEGTLALTPPPDIFAVPTGAGATAAAAAGAGLVPANAFPIAFPSSCLPVSLAPLDTSLAAAQLPPSAAWQAQARTNLSPTAAPANSQGPWNCVSDVQHALASPLLSSTAAASGASSSSSLRTGTRNTRNRLPGPRQPSSNVHPHPPTGLEPTDPTVPTTCNSAPVSSISTPASAPASANSVRVQVLSVPEGAAASRPRGVAVAAVAVAAMAASSTTTSAAPATPALSSFDQPAVPSSHSPPTGAAASISAPASSSAPTPAAAAMPARPAKRPADSDDGVVSPGQTSHSAQSPAGKLKLPRLDRGPEDFSSVVKTRLQSYTRTGQACDRCKVRKIRCDALPEGCTNCTNQSLECFVTDRVTGRTERRGYLQELERQKTDMMAHIRELEKILEQNNVEVKPFQWSPFSQSMPAGYTFDGSGTIRDTFSKDSWTQSGPVWVKTHKDKTQYTPTFPRALLKSLPADIHLGLDSDNAPLSSIKGTRLSILGATIDVTSFDAPDIDEPQQGSGGRPQPLYNKSAQSFLQSTMNINPVLEDVHLPPREEGFTYSEWYFLMIYPFVPVLHKPTYMNLLTRIYDEEGFEPSPSELVIVHMVFAIIYFHYGVRNWEKAEQRAHLNDLSNKHFHYALSKFFDISLSQTLTAVQAMAMIASHSRSFPKPSCGSLIASFALDRAIELNLHRAAKNLDGGTNLENEMRKRTWWTILLVTVTLNGRLGKPMPIAVEDFDVDFPEPIADELLTADGVDTSRQGTVPYHIGLAGMRIVPLFMEMYANIYSVRRDPKSYPHTVEALEEQLRIWRESLPDELRWWLPVQAGQEPRVYALYAQHFALEFRLCLRHPSVAMTTDRKLMAENSHICEETAGEMLTVVHTLLKLKSLDTTWYQISVFTAAIFSTLVAYWERRFEATASDIAKLRREMNLWLSVLNATTVFLGEPTASGSRIGREVSVTIERTIGWIEHDMKQKDIASPTPASSSQFNGSHTPTNGVFPNGQTPYPAVDFDQGASGSTAAPTFDTGGALVYSGTRGAAESENSATNPLVAFASQAAQHVSQPTGAGDANLLWRQTGGQSNGWLQWTAAIADSQDRYSANALLTLGSSVPRGATSMDAATGGVSPSITDATETSHTEQWPLLLFNNSATTNGT